MRALSKSMIGRRSVLGGMAGLGIMALPGCATVQRDSLTEAVRRLLLVASENAFARLTAPGGFYDDAFNRIELPGQYRKSGSAVADFLTSAVFKTRLEKAFGRMAERGADRAAPLVVDAIRLAAIPDAQRVIHGGPTGATEFLRRAMGGSLVEAMVPELGDAIRLTDEPLVAQAIASFTGIDNAGGMARNLAGQVDDRIWNAIGREEAAMRANPGSIRDPMLRHLFSAP